MISKRLRRAIITKNVFEVKKALENAGINSFDDYGNTPLHLAYQYGTLEIINLLKSKGANPYMRNDEDLIPFFSLARNKDTTLVDDLVEAKEDFNQTDEEGRSILYHTIFYGTDEMLKKLLAIGMNPNVYDFSGWTPLHLATHLRKVSKQRILLEAGAIYDARDKKKRIPMHHCAANPNKEAVEMLLAKDTSHVNEWDSDYNTPFYNALKYGTIEVVRIMSPYADVNQLGKRRMTSLHYIVDGLTNHILWKMDDANDIKVINDLLDEVIEKINVVIEKGADIKWKNANNRTAAEELVNVIHEFRKYERVQEVVRLLS